MSEVAYFDGLDKAFLTPLYSLSIFTDFVMIPVVLLGFLGEMLIINTLLRQGYQYLSLNNHYVLLMCFSDSLSALLFLGFRFTDIIQSQGDITWTTGKIGCIYQSHALLIFQFLSLNSVLLMTADRFLLVYFQYRLDKKTIQTVITAAFLNGIAMYFIINFLPLAEYYFAIQSSKVYCFLPAWSGNLFIQISITLMCMFILTLIPFVAITYLSVFNLYRKLLKSKGGRKPKSATRNESKLLMKCLAISTAFLLSYSPISIKFLVEVAMKTPVSPEVDSACYFLAISNSFTNVLVIYFFDYEIHRSINQLFKKTRHQGSNKPLVSQKDENIDQMGVEMNAKIKSNSGNSPIVVDAQGDTKTIKLGNVNPNVNNVFGNNEDMDTVDIAKENSRGYS